MSGGCDASGSRACRSPRASIPSFMNALRAATGQRFRTYPMGELRAA
jgi:hypothetical protein